MITGQTRHNARELKGAGTDNYRAVPVCIENTYIHTSECSPNICDPKFAWDLGLQVGNYKRLNYM